MSFDMGGGGKGFGKIMRGNMTPEEKAALPKITKEMVKRAANYIVPYWKQVAFVILIIIASSILNVFPTIISGKIIDDGFNGGDFKILAILIGLSFGLFIFSNLLNILQTYINAWVSQHIVFDMRNQMYRHLEFMSHKFFTTEKTGDIITRMTSDINGVRDVISNTMPSILSNTVVLITTIVAMYSKNWVLATIGIIFVPLFIIPTKKVGKKRFDITLQTQKKHDEMNQLINETLNVSGSLLVKIFTKEESEYNKYNRVNKEIIKLNLKENLIGRWFRMFIGIISNMGPTIIYLVGGVMMLILDVGDLTVGDITVLVGLINRLYGPVNSLLNVQIDIARSMAHFQRIFGYFDKPHDIADKPDAVALDIMKGAIDFENVSFYYEEASPILKAVSFHVDSGKTVAIVGPSGAGKSTVINLIPRLYDVISGSIKIDGIDIRDISLHSLRGNIGFVTQDSYLFNGTIKENLLYANENATDNMIEEACKKANIHDFIMQLPDKYDAIVGNRGLKLSGGEKQRISLARVILRDPKILILDEATSALDSISESLIQQAIEPLLKNRTSVVIAHRLSTIMAADEILVVEKGEIVEQGTHHDLLAKNGTYRTLYETQFKQAIEDVKQFHADNAVGLV